jgi:hypothetical protein
MNTDDSLFLSENMRSFCCDHGTYSMPQILDTIQSPIDEERVGNPPDSDGNAFFLLSCEGLVAMDAIDRLRAII